MSDEVYLWVDGAAGGPFCLSEVAEMVKAGRVSLEDQWSSDGVTDWRTLGEIVTVTEPYVKQTTELCPDCSGIVSVRAVSCPHCGAPFAKHPPIPSRPRVVPSASELIMPTVGFATRKRKGEMMGAGCVVQGVGVVLLVFFWPVGVALLLAGGLMGSYWACGNCQNKIDKAARTCPACRFSIQA
jgi:RNA polymerase subunit RPABC4/transcription elongation factor Spt4